MIDQRDWRARGGKAATDNGTIFENRFEAVAMYAGFAVTRMPNGCRQAGKKLIRIKTACDWILTREGRTLLVDTKTTKERRFSHSMIDQSQVFKMLPHETRGGRAGYVVELRGSNTVIFVPASVLAERLRSGSGSIGPFDQGIMVLGSPDKFDPKILIHPPWSYP